MVNIIGVPPFPHREQSKNQEPERLPGIDTNEEGHNEENVDVRTRRAYERWGKRNGGRMLQVIRWVGMNEPELVLQSSRQAHIR